MLYKVLVNRRVCLPGLCVCGRLSHCLCNCLSQAPKCRVWPRGPWVTHLLGTPIVHFPGWAYFCGQASQWGARGVSMSCDLSQSSAYVWVGGGVQTQAPHPWQLSTPLVIACFFSFSQSAVASSLSCLLHGCVTLLGRASLWVGWGSVAPLP